MSLYIGRDNSGNGIFHATKDEQTEAQLKAGINEKTLFHSDLPFIRVGATYNLSLTSREARPSGYPQMRAASEYWAFPTDMKNDLIAGYVFIGYATLSDGSTVQIESDKYGVYSETVRVHSSQGGGNWSFYCFGHNQEGDAATGNGLRFSFPTTRVDIFSSVNTTTPAWFVNTYGPRLWSQYSGGWAGRNSTSAETSTGNMAPYLKRNSSGVLMTRTGRFGKYQSSSSQTNVDDCISGRSTGVQETPYATSIVFYRLQVKANTSGFYPVALSQPNPGEMYIDNSQLLSNGANHLSNMKYIKFRAFAADNTTVSPTTPGGIILPGNVYTYSQSNSGWPAGTLGVQANTLINHNTVRTLDVAGFRKPYAVYVGGKYRTYTYGNFTCSVTTIASSITPTSTMDSAITALDNYQGALYELVSIPSVSRIEFDNTSFRINDSIDLYTPTNQPVACIGENRQLSLGTATRTIYPGGVVATLEDSINLGSGLGSHLHLMYGIAKISASDQYIYSKWEHTGGVTSFNAPSDAETTDPDLGANLIAIPQNAYVPIGTMRFTGEDRYSPPDDHAAVGVSLCLRYTGTTVQLWTLARHTSSVTGYMQYQMPRARINIMRLTSG